jgi:FAD/FMN-containing dehydrogenase
LFKTRRHGAHSFELVPDLAEFGNSLDGELFSPDSPGYEAIRRPVNLAYQDVCPRLVVRCRSVSDVVSAVTYATATGDRITPRGGGHCFAGRSSTDGIVLDMSGLDGISVATDRVATIGAGARLGQVYAALHACDRTLPAGAVPPSGSPASLWAAGSACSGASTG